MFPNALILILSSGLDDDWSILGRHFLLRNIIMGQKYISPSSALFSDKALLIFDKL